MSTATSRRVAGRLVILSTATMFPILAQAPPPQEPEPLPFMEPAELHQMTTLEAFAEASPAQNGRWDTLPYGMPINPVHAAVMHTGKVLVVAGSGNDAENKRFQAALWDPGAGTVRTFNVGWDMFCNGMVILPDGWPFVLGGTLKYDPFLGEPRTSVFNPVKERFVDRPRMSGGRWYPTGTVLGDGSVLVYSGLSDTDGQMNRTVEIWKKDAFTPAGTAFPRVPFYPREHLLPDGKVFVSGWNRESWMYDPATRTFAQVTTTRLDRERVYGTSVLLPLTPANGFKPTVMILGGGSPGSDTTELIDLSLPGPQWVFGPKMVKGRIQLNATLLPNGKVLVSGGSSIDEDNASAVKQAELYDPESNTLSSASTMGFPRLYHSNTLLLPDATVATLGGNPQRKVYQHEIEIYSPPYLFNADGSRAKRPALGTVPSRPVRYGAPFQVSTASAVSIRSVVLIRAGSATHAFDMEQRLVGLAFTTGKGLLKVTAPANGNLAPPGYYLLFLVDDKGVPSVGKFVRLR